VALPVLVQFPNDPFACLWFLQIATFSMLPLLIKDGLIFAYVGLTLVWVLLPTIISELETDGPCSSSGDFLNMAYYLNLLKPVKEKRFLGIEDKVLQGICITMYYASLWLSVALIVCSFWIPPPANMPDLYPLLVSAFSCVHFVGFLIYFNYKQLVAK
jgi:alpha-1,3-glucosyltransferase